MKKLLLLGTSLFLSCVTFAQQRAHGLTDGPAPTIDLSSKGPMTAVHPSNVATKKTRGGSRWYNQAAAISSTSNNLFDGTHYRVNYLWQDSTMKANYGGTQSPIWIKSIAQVLDPSTDIFNDPAMFAGEIGVSNGTGTFTVDSVGITCAYTRSAAKPTVVDTLIVTVGSGNGAGLDLFFWSEKSATSSWVSDYGTDTLFIADPAFDFTKLTMAKGTSSVAYTVKYPLTAASANDTLSSGWNYFQIPVTGVTCNASHLPVMTVTFKSGDTWTPLVDSIGSNHNYFLFASSKENPPSNKRSYTKGDYNMSSILENDTTGWGDLYIPSFYFTNPSYEYHWFDWKITCPGCFPVGVEAVENQGISVNMVPNPAANNAKLVLNLNEEGKNVVLTLTNSVGQLVKTVNIGNVNSNTLKYYDVNLSDLSDGLYFYTLNVDGKKVSNKLQINK